MSQDKVEQLKTAMKAKKDAESRLAAAQEQGGLAPGLEDQYKAKLSELESALEQARALAEEQTAKAKEMNDKYLRLYAESDNARKRAAKDKEDAIRYGNEKFIKELLPVIDGLEQALSHAESEDKASIVEGVQLVLKQFFKVLENFGVTPVDAVGLPFDPYHHEAIAHHESEEHEPHSVVSQYRRGYKLHDRLIRPSLVTVAKPPEGSK
ncbi:MAG TPA: nucleotide exchange factor GrpE [Deltaproteobacteria bacterium]|nr:nucleotide exchange factor GrpE [Deltaproteobacteria bacterium]